MHLQYGTIDLHVIDLQRYDRVNIYTPDGADLLYVRHTLGVVATYAPGGSPRMPSARRLSPDTSGRLSGADPTAGILARNPRGGEPGEAAAIVDPPVLETDFGLAGPPAPAGVLRSGPETDSELRNRLLRPRQKLILWVYDRQTGQPVRWLESPRPGFTVDCTVGPVPLSCDVVHATGEPSNVGVYYQIRTDLQPCPLGSDRLVLSHRWQMSHGHDSNHYLTRVIEGEIVFNAAVRDLLGAQPDQFRSQFIHPIPLGFRRDPPEVTMSSDGTTLHYVVRDVDPTIVFAPGDSGCTAIEIFERHTLSVPSLVI